MQFSIIIPVFKDWDRLYQTLKSVVELNYQKQYELIVVNNDESNVVPKKMMDFKNVILIHENSPGSYAARNAAIKIAKGEILAFTDSDCILDSNWLDNASRHFADTEVKRIGGRVKLFFQESKKTSVELYEEIFAFDQKSSVHKTKASVTANFFARKELFDKYGLFDSSKMSGEDIGWNKRVSSFDEPILYAPDVIVSHPARRTFAEIAKKRRRVFRGKKKVDLKSASGVMKEMVYLPFLFTRYLIKVWNAFKLRKSNSILDFCKILSVIFFLYFVDVNEYFKIMLEKLKLRF